jgi:UDP-N-acetylmuramoyl-L-alanyl-D-glutamate--2,6-diaminopimelate ligase
MSGSLADIRDALRQAGLLTGDSGTLPAQVESITDDSRAVRRDALFLAVRGAERDGHAYLAVAAERGAIAAIVDDASRTTLPALVVSDTRRAAAVAATAFYGEPAASLRLVGGAGAPFDGGSGLTPPGPVELQRVLRALHDEGVRTVAMETSSHALHQRRVEGLHFAAGVFTNLTRDHLDYHGTMESYFAAKALLVGQLAPGGVAVVNADDRAWDSLPAAPRTVRFGLGAAADVRARNVRSTPEGSRFALLLGTESHDVVLPMIGDFNVANALAAAATAWALGTPGDTIAARLATMPQVPGRLEIVNERPTVLRDYAHTPDSLERSIAAVRPFARGRLIVVFGCGGDRDRGKRPEMGRIAARGADVAIVTSDNPRTEDPERILDDIEAGMDDTPHERIEDRRDAIARAIELAGPDDLVLLAGKGHETYQVRGTTKLPFDEREIVREIMTERVS